jgi:hypothetical protein
MVPLFEIDGPAPTLAELAEAMGVPVEVLARGEREAIREALLTLSDDPSAWISPEETDHGTT